MNNSQEIKEGLFIPFEEVFLDNALPLLFTNPFLYEPHPISLLAVEKLQQHLLHQKDWIHDFGIPTNDSKENRIGLGKMFGVLVVRNQQQQLGYLSAFSGKLAGKNHHPKFVPPVFDSLEEGSFLNIGMVELTRMNEEIKVLVALDEVGNLLKINVLKENRKIHSNALQKKLFEHYIFLNVEGTEKSLLEIFETTAEKNPPSGAGECAAPKLLHYAFQHKLTPIALAEFWWGISPKSEQRQHRQFYPACQEKCQPILTHMLKGIIINESN